MRDEMLGKEEGVSREERIKFKSLPSLVYVETIKSGRWYIAVSNGVADAIAR